MELQSTVMEVLPADNLNQGHGVQVVDMTDNHTYRLNKEELERILLREDVKDLPVVLVSVAGAFRGGKSFLLNFFLRYLTAPEDQRNESGDWLGKDDETLKGFSWRGGKNRHTTGILMWSEPFIRTLPSGEKVAVLVMDTQGTFDSSSTVRDCSTIFALSTLVSSVQIYNLKENIKEDDLQHLQLFTQYGKSIKTDDGSKPFQVLEFLVRDWPFPYENDYGQVGGDEFLAERLKVTDDMPAELRELRQHIRACFDTVTCFLMPHPGNNVRNRTFAGKLSELDQTFKEALMALVPSIFAPNNLTPKLMNGQKVKARDLMEYFKSYMQIFNSDKVPTVSSIIKASTQAALLAAVSEARALYDTRMKEVSSDAKSLPGQALEGEHRRAVTAAQAAFDDKKTMASKKESDAYRAQMSHELDESLPQFTLINEGKLRKAVEEARETYATTIRRVHGTNLLCLHPQDLEDIHEEAVNAALAVFNAKRKVVSGIHDVEKTKLIEVLQSQLEGLKNTNIQHNKMYVSAVQVEFGAAMEGLLSKNPPLEDAEFTAKYEEAKTKAIDAFEAKRNKTSQHTDDQYKASLLQAMSSQFFSLEMVNKSRNRQAFQSAIDFYNNYMKMFWDPEQCCLHPDDLKTAHQNAKGQALHMFRSDSSDDFEKDLLNQILEFKYYALKDQNNNLNEMAVSAGIDKYIAYMDEKCQASPWWLLVVPMIVLLAKLPKYHREAREAALLVFYNRRRDTNNSAYDTYLTQLNNKINDASRRYL